MNFSLDDVMRICGAPEGAGDHTAPAAPGSKSDWQASGVSIDSRTTKPGNIFICIRGENHDGHAYVSAALAKGAAAVIAEKGVDIGALDKAFQEGSTRASGTAASVPVFRVPDTLVALQSLGAVARDTYKGLVIGVTGSNGKTSAKEMLFGMLSHLYGAGQVHATEGNLNNHLGVPLTLCAASGHEKAFVIEMGMNHSGEIALLSKIARPSGALITSISGAHMEFFESIEEIAAAKLEITSGMSPKGVLAYPAAAPRQDLARSLSQSAGCALVSFALDNASINISRDGIRFPFKGHTVVNANYASSVMASNLYGALSLLSAMGFEDNALIEAAAQAKPLTGRRFQLRRKSDGAGPLLVDDSYNANPDSYVQAVQNLRRLIPVGRLVLFAGEMAELGQGADAGHRAVGEAAARAGFDCVVAAGTQGADILIEEFVKFAPGKRVIRARDAAEIVGIVDKEPGLMECDGILVKGSRSARMDIVSDAVGKRGYV